MSQNIATAVAFAQLEQEHSATEQNVNLIQRVHFRECFIQARKQPRLHTISTHLVHFTLIGRLQVLYHTHSLTHTHTHTHTHIYIYIKEYVKNGCFLSKQTRVYYYMFLFSNYQKCINKCQ